MRLPAVDENWKDDPAYFYCEYFRCTMRKEKCAANRQEAERRRGIISAGKWNGFKGSVGGWKLIFDACPTCGQGKQIEKEVNAMADDVCKVEGCGRPIFTKDGRCREHMLEDARKARSEKSGNVEEPKQLMFKEPGQITIDLESRFVEEGFRAHLEDMAREQMRPVELQALYLIRKGMKFTRTERGANQDA